MQQHNVLKTAEIMSKQQLGCGLDEREIVIKLKAGRDSYLLRNVHNGSGSQPASYGIVIKCSSSGEKAAGH